MAAELVGGAFLFASLQVLFEKMASGDVHEFIWRIKLKDCLLKKLTIKLLSANSVLNDIEEKQMKNKAVTEWLAVAELKEAICDAEDLVDEIKSEALQWKIYGESGSSSHQVFKTQLHEEHLATSLVEESGVYGRDDDKEATQMKSF